MIGPASRKLSHVGSVGTFSSMAMRVMRMAITPSLNASNLLFCMRTIWVLKQKPSTIASYNLQICLGSEVYTSEQTKSLRDNK